MRTTYMIMVLIIITGFSVNIVSAACAPNGCSSEIDPGLFSKITEGGDHGHATVAWNGENWVILKINYMPPQAKANGRSDPYMITLNKCSVLPYDVCRRVTF